MQRAVIWRHGTISCIDTFVLIFVYFPLFEFLFFLNGRGMSSCPQLSYLLSSDAWGWPVRDAWRDSTELCIGIIDGAM